MSVKASGGSPLVRPQLYRTASISTIAQAEQQDRFLQLGELNELVTFLNSGVKRLEIAELIAKNANILVSKAADKIFVGGSAISYLEKPQASFLSDPEIKMSIDPQLSGDTQKDLLGGLRSTFKSGEGLPPGFKPINISKYGSDRMQKSLRDLDWFLRYLTYAIIAGDPNILTVNIRGLKDLIESACSSAAAIVALREMRKEALNLVIKDSGEEALIREYFNVLISEFEASSLSDSLRKRDSLDLQGLRLPQIYAKAGVSVQKFSMKFSLSVNEKKAVIKACYRQVFERDIDKAYSLSISDLESQVINGIISIKEFIRALGKSYLYRKNFCQPFVNSRVVELAFRHFLGRGPSSLKEFQRYFSVLSLRGLDGLIDSLINSKEYADYFGEETVPYNRLLGEEPQECSNWGPQLDLFNYSAPFRKIPQFITLFSDYTKALPDQHPYGLSNDPLSIQFGAIFPDNKLELRKKSAPFGKSTRRILIRRGPGILSQISGPNRRSKFNSLSGIKVFKLDYSGSKDSESIETIINAIYLRIFGRLVYKEELVSLKKIEIKFRDRDLSVRNFILALAKSSVFKSLYWQPFYICKAIEYIHNRILGRPTYGRQEINQYFNIIYKQGYDKFIDAIFNSSEYLEVFGENIVPYERYITPLGLSARTLKSGINKDSGKRQSIPNRFIELGQLSQSISSYKLRDQINQGVSSVRDQLIVFEAKNNTDKLVLEKILRAAYRQIFERDISTFSATFEFIAIDRSFLSNELTVKQLIRELGLSQLYAKEFYQPYPNTKVIELATKHFLGRAPKNQAEIRFYNQILASKGLNTFISLLIESQEYNVIFGENTVPYRRFPTLPAANFPNTSKLYNTFTKQNNKIIVPSFIA